METALFNRVVHGTNKVFKEGKLIGVKENFEIESNKTNAVDSYLSFAL